MRRTAFTKPNYEEIMFKLAIRDEVARSSPKPRKPLKRANRWIVKADNTRMKKVKTITQLKKELWKLFSLWVRDRDRYTCVTCGKKGEGSQIHAGHFITGATCTAELYFDHRNVHAQCYHCNINLSGNWVRYEEYMKNYYGKDTVEELKKRRTLEMGKKVDSQWYMDRIEEYKLLLKIYPPKISTVA